MFFPEGNLELERVETSLRIEDLKKTKQMTTDHLPFMTLADRGFKA